MKHLNVHAGARPIIALAAAADQGVVVTASKWVRFHP
jgi:hypothetical protein